MGKVLLWVTVYQKYQDVYKPLPEKEMPVQQSPIEEMFTDVNSFEHLLSNTPHHIIPKIKPFSSDINNIHYHITCGKVMQNITLKETKLKCERIHIKRQYPEQQMYLSQNLQTKYSHKQMPMKILLKKKKKKFYP